MNVDVKNHVKNCETCKTCKPSNYTMRPLMGAYTEYNRTWQKIYIDFLGPYPRSKKGNTMLLIVLDHVSKFVVLKAVKFGTSQAVVDFLNHDIFHLFGVPEVLVSDNGRQFESRLLAEFLDSHGVTHVFTPKYSPQSNASERVNRTILAAIRSYLRDRHQDWDVYLDPIAGALRNVSHESTGYSPYYQVFGQHMIHHSSLYQVQRELESIDPCERYFGDTNRQRAEIHNNILVNLRNAHHKHATQYNRKASERSFNVNQTVYVRNFHKSSGPDGYSGKLAPQFLKGRITRRIGNVAYEVIDEKGKILGIFHGKDIKT